VCSSDLNVIAAIATAGFNANLFPYWSLMPPHFDRNEFFEWAVRPPMLKPAIRKLPNTPTDLGTLNRILDRAFQFCYQYIYTDGRQTITSPFSLPSIVKSTDFLSNPDFLSKKIELELYAGSAMVESINIFYRVTRFRLDEAGTNLLTYSNWSRYDNVKKFTDCGVNSKFVIGNSYWLRQNAWDGYGYDATANTIKYVFDNSKLGQIVPQELFERYQDMPSRSVALSNLGDSLMLANNEYGFNNFGCEITNSINASIGYVGNAGCTTPLRTIKMYAYIGRNRGNKGAQDLPRIDNIFHSQVGYYVGDDKQMRFGGQYVNQDGPVFEDAESKYFELDFADKDSLTVYLKGTPYYADAEWYVCKNNFDLERIETLVNSKSESDIAFVNQTLDNFGFFVAVFTLVVPAGRYVATLGRHNVSTQGDFRGTSTYILGVANSRLASISSYFQGDGSDRISVKTVKPNAIVSRSKEIEIDCTQSDVDLWGRGSLGDLFYVFAPCFGSGSGRNRWQFVEGFLYESQANKIPMERFSYELFDSSSNQGLEFNGNYTDKNGFFFSWVTGGADEQNMDLRFPIKKDCNQPFTFVVPVSDGASWKKGQLVYFDTYNGGNVGVANRILINGRITDVTGTIGYSNIAVGIVDGAVDYTDNNGNFSLVVHNGIVGNTRINNIYINAGGNFAIFIDGCGYVPLTQYNEGNPLITPSCALSIQNNQDRLYPQLNQRVVVSSNDQTSIKSNSNIAVTVIGADLAGRVTSAQKISELTVDSFNQRLPNGNLLPSVINWATSGGYSLPPEIKWVSFAVSKSSNYKKYIQWVGDYIKFVDASGNETDNPSTASLVKIGIGSLLEANIQRNFSLLSAYQFVINDRMRIYDNGEGVLFDTATYGGIIDVEVQGTNYNQSAINANLIPPSSNTVLNSGNTGADPTVLYALYDSRFDKLKDKKGFWIELYTPAENNEELPFFEASRYYPVINGAIAEYIGGGVNNPQYNFPTSGTLEYWDTYFLSRSIAIPDVGNRYVQHPFESPNVTDTWGYNLSSGGRANAINPYAAKTWYLDSIIRSDDFVSEGLINGLATFRSDNKKSFKGYQRGGIVAISCQFSVIFFLCQNDFFVTDFNYNYIYANAQGVQVANLDKSLGEPHQKIGSNYGASYEDTRAIIMYDKYIFFYDRKNEAFIMSDYRGASDITDMTDNEGRKYGVKSYMVKKTQFITQWNNSASIDRIFDVVAGIDTVRKNVFLTFRPRRSNNNTPESFVNNIRNIHLPANETLVFNIDRGKWTKFEGFTPEGYGKVRGASSGVQLVSFANGRPYLHNKDVKGSSLNFYGVQTEPVISIVVNKTVGETKILQSLSQIGNGNLMYVDSAYSGQPNTHSYIPYNLWDRREGAFYACLQRDMASYFSQFDVKTFRSTFVDGKRIFGNNFVVRFVGNPTNDDAYFEIIFFDSLFTFSAPVLKA
jgi:hypothetical protein